MVLGLMSAVVGIAISRPAYVYLVNVPESFLDLTLTYFRIYAIGLIFQLAVNGFGQAMTASFTVGQRMEVYINLPFNALQTTLATYAGQNAGAGKIDRIKKGARQTIIISFFMTMIIAALVRYFAGDIVALFGLSDFAAEYCIAHLKTVAIINIVLAMYIPLFGLYQGTGHSAFPMIVACVALGMRVLATYLFRYSPFLGHTIIWWNGIFGFSLGFLITWSYYLSGRWQKGSRLTEKMQ